MSHGFNRLCQFFQCKVYHATLKQSVPKVQSVLGSKVSVSRTYAVRTIINATCGASALHSLHYRLYKGL